MKNLYLPINTVFRPAFYSNYILVFVFSVLFSLLYAPSNAQTFRNSAKASAKTGVTSLTVSKPTGTVAGDVMIASIATRPFDVSITAPTGWTLLRLTRNSVGASNGGGDNVQAVYYRVAGAAEAASYKWSFDKSEGSVGGILSFLNVDTNNPVDVDSSQTNGLNLAFFTPDVTTTYPSEMLISTFCFGSCASWTTPKGMVQVVDIASDPVPYVYGESMCMNYGIQAAAGPTGIIRDTASDYAEVGVSSIIALIPATRIKYPSPSYCQNGGTVSVNRTGLSGGRYTASPAGLSIKQVQGDVDLSKSSPGTYTVTYTYTNQGSNYTATTTITIDPPTVAGAVSSNATVCSGTNGNTLNLNGETGRVLYWQYSVNNGSTWTNISNTNDFQAYSNLTQTTLYRAVVQSGSCTAATSAAATITVIPGSVGGTVSSNATVCSGSNGGTLTLTGKTGNVVRWESSIDNGTSWTPIANTGTSQAYTNISQTTLYRAVVQNGGCAAANSSAVTITVIPASVGGTVSGSAGYCSVSGSGTLTLNGQTGSVVRWESSNNGGTTWNLIANTTASQAYNNLSQTTQYRAVVQNGTCATATAVPATITVSPPSVGGTVNSSTTVCSGSSGTLNLTGQTGGVIRWESSTDAGATWIGVNNTTTSLGYSNITQTTQYRAVVQSGVCATANSSAATITVNSASVAGAVNTSSTVCAGANGTLTLTGHTGIVTGWEFSTNGGGSWSSITNPTTLQTYSNISQTTQYRAVVQSGVCPAVRSTAATITVNPTSVGGTVNTSAAVCSASNGTLNLTGNTGSILRWESSIDGGSSWSSIANTTPSLSYTNITQTTRYRAVVQSGVCVPANSTAAIITVTPTVGTPTPITVASGAEPSCQLTNSTTTTTYSTTASNNTGYNWSLSNPSAGSINPSSGVITWANGFAGSVNIQVTASGCFGPSSMVIRPVTITPTVGTPTPITISAGTEPACQLTNGTTTTSYATTATNSTGYTWSLSNASAGSINPATGIMTWANGFSGSVNIQVRAIGCNGPSSQVNRPVTITPTVGTPLGIAVTGGTEPNCQLVNSTTTTTYSTFAFYSTGYNWSLSNPAAGSINATTGVMTWANGFSGTVDIQVSANGCNGPSAQVVRTVTVTPTVGTPTPISISAGADPSCQLTNSTTSTTYATTAANNTGYNWSLSNAAAGTINASNGAVTWANGFSGSVNIRVTANGCNGPSAQVVHAVAITPTVGTPAAISISAGAQPSCQLTNATTTTTYATTATNSTGYMWSLSNAAAGSINAATGLMTWANGFSGSVNIQVKAIGCNGPSAQVIRSVTVTPSVGVPVFSSGSTSNRCQAAGTVTYSATAANATTITYSLDGTSLAAGNTINSAGQVTYVAGWSGTSVITATAVGCNGPTTATHTVTTAVAPSANFVYTANPYCTNGGNASVNLTGTTGGTFSSTTGLSIDPATGYVNIQTSTPGSYTVSYTIAASGSCPTYAVSTPLDINIHAIWNGSVSRNWHDPNNWSCGGVPTLTSNAVIPSSMPRYPIIYSGLGTTHNLTIQPGAYIVDSGALTIAGAIYNRGFIDALAGKVEFAATAATVVPSSLFYSKTIKDLVISDSAGVTLTGPLRVTGSVAFGNVNNTTFITGDSLTLASVPASDAQVKDITNGGLNSGNSIKGLVIVERYMPAKRAYRFLTAPVNSAGSIKANWMENAMNPDNYNRANPFPGYGTNITGAGDTLNGFDPTQTHNPSMFTFNNLNQSWVAIPNTRSLMKVGNAYRIIVRGDRNIDMNTNTPPPTPTTLRATGTIAQGDIKLSKAGGGGTQGIGYLSSNPGDFNLIANPYPSAIDWLTVDKTDLAGTIYIFDPNVAGSNKRGGYVAYNCTIGTSNDSTSCVDNYVQSGQAFFVETRGTNPTVTFKETDKASVHRSVFRSASTIPNMSVQLLLPASQGVVQAADAAKVFFSNDYDSKVGNEDSYKFTNQDENLAVMSSGIALSIEGRKPVAGSDSVSLKLWQLTQKNYLLKISFNNFSYNGEAYLKDKYLGTIIQLNTNSETIVPVNITSNAASGAADRYKIVFEGYSTLPLHILAVKAAQKNNGIEIGWIAESESNMDRYDVEKSPDGKQFVTAGSVKATTNPGASTQYFWFDLIPFDGYNYYRIKAADKAGVIKYSSIVKIKTARESSSISVYPNPVDGKVITLAFSSVNKGNYTVSLINTSGKVVYNGKIFFGGGSGYEQIDLNSYLPSGIYQLQLNDDNLTKTIQLVIK